MQQINEEQGTTGWHEARNESDGTASQAPQMMNESKYGTRDELLREKKTGNRKPVSAKQQEIFDSGHATEAAARPIIEELIDDDLYPVTGINEFEGLNLLASFDGLTMDEDIVFEHKLWNKSLAENVFNGIIEPHYYWQLEQQLLVSGAGRAIFVTSDGTKDNMEYSWYESVPERREKLIAGWKQFNIDLENYEVKAIAEKVEAESIDTFPSLNIECSGAVTISNLPQVEKQLTTMVDGFKTELKTDSDFANAEAAVKWLKDGREALKTAKTNALNKTQDIKVLFETIKRMDGVMQVKYSELDKLVKSEKTHRKEEAVKDGILDIIGHNSQIESELQGYRLPSVAYKDVFTATTKGKRNMDKIIGGINDAVAQAKIDSNAIAGVMRSNLSALDEHASEHKFLFNDFNEMICKDSEHTLLLIKQRISSHEEEKRQQAQREATAEAERKKREKEAFDTNAKNQIINIRNLGVDQSIDKSDYAIKYYKGELESVEAIQIKADIFGDFLEDALKTKTEVIESLNKLISENEIKFNEEQQKTEEVAEPEVTITKTVTNKNPPLEENHKNVVGNIIDNVNHNAEGLKVEAFELLKKTEQKFHAYAGACDIGEERERAFAIYENIRTANRNT